MTAGAVSLALILAAMWAVACRFNAMERGVTKVRVALQHGAIGLALVSALVLPPDWARAALAAGIFLHFALSAHRWRHGAPEGTRVAPQQRQEAQQPQQTSGQPTP